MLVSLPSIVPAAPGLWSGLGPAGGEIADIVADPNTSGHFYAATRFGVFKSTDGGVSWADRSNGIPAQVRGRLAHSPDLAGVLFVVGFDTVLFSGDGALSWEDRTPALPADAQPLDLDFAPSRSGRVYMATLEGQVFRSDDLGLTWSSPTVPAANFNVWQLAVDPADSNRVLAAGNDAVAPGEMRLFASADGGASWGEVLCGGGCPWAGTAPEPLDLVFAGTGDGYLTTRTTTYKSVDSGASWAGLGNFLGDRLSVHPSNPDRIVASFNGGAFGSDGGIRFTDDAGTTVEADRDNFAANGTEVSQSTAVEHDPFDPEVVLAGTTVNGVYRRTGAPPAGGGSATWVRSDDGLESQLIRAVAVAPGSGRLHAGVGDAFTPGQPVARSIDGGATWTYTTGPEAYQLRQLAIDPNDTDIVYGTGSKGSGPAIGGGSSAPNGGVYKSSDGGATWATSDNGIPVGTFSSPFGTVRDIALDSTSALGGTGALQTLYVSGSGRLRRDSGGALVVDAARVYKSTDAGAIWTASDNGLGGTEDIGGFDAWAAGVELAQGPADPTGQTLYISTFIVGCCQAGGPLPNSLANGVFKTVDGGANWMHASTGLPRIEGDPTASHQNVLALAIDPTDPTGQTLYASANDPTLRFSGSVYKTVDGGASWFFSGAGLTDRDVRDILVDPVTGEVYLAVADPFARGDGGVFFSDDGGAIWSAVGPGFPPTAAALQLALDRSGTNPVLYAGTGRSVQTIELLPDADIDGVSDETEASAPGSGDGDDDGTPDSDQTETASLPRGTFADGEPAGGGGTTRSSLAAHATEQGFVTVALGTAADGDCSRLERVESLPDSGPAGLPPPAGRSMPGGVLRWRIPDCGEVGVEITYHGLGFDTTARFLVFAPDEQERWSWRDMDAAAASETWTLVLSDGGPGDVTADGDGVILVQGGASELAERFFNNGFEVR